MDVLEKALARMQELRAKARARSVYAAKPLVAQRRLLPSDEADRLVRELRARHGDQALAELERACAAARRVAPPRADAREPAQKPQAPKRREGAVGEPPKPKPKADTP